jgi:hypothetical protein
LKKPAADDVARPGSETDEVTAPEAAGGTGSPSPSETIAGCGGFGHRDRAFVGRGPVGGRASAAAQRIHSWHMGM